MHGAALGPDIYFGTLTRRPSTYLPTGHAVASGPCDAAERPCALAAGPRVPDRAPGSFPGRHAAGESSSPHRCVHCEPWTALTGQKKKQPQPSSSSPPEATSPPPPVVTKADADLMLPSDSDDDAPEGGYYVVESSRPLSPKAPRQPLSPREAPRTIFGSAATRVRSHSLTGQTAGSPSQRQTEPTIREREELQPSESDDEAPPGGYEVHQSDFAKNRAAILERNRNRPRTRSDTRATESLIPAAPGASGATDAEASGLSRRKTVPARLLGQKKLPHVRRNSREAP